MRPRSATGRGDGVGRPLTRPPSLDVTEEVSPASPPGLIGMPIPTGGSRQRPTTDARHAQARMAADPQAYATSPAETVSVEPEGLLPPGQPRPPPVGGSLWSPAGAGPSPRVAASAHHVHSLHQRAKSASTQRLEDADIAHAICIMRGVPAFCKLSLDTMARVGERYISVTFPAQFSLNVSSLSTHFSATNIAG